MATVTHIIRSHYDPADREKLERETGQYTNNQSDAWQTESSFLTQRRIRAGPTFVPATVSYDEWGIPSHTTPSKPPYGPSTSTAEWYKSLTATLAAREGSPPRSSSIPSPSPRPAQKPSQESVKKSNWFISKVLRSAPSTKPISPALSLGDMLSRDPPPLPSKGRYTPPVWLHIGPSNRGFGMLQRSGWNEGEGLGLGAHVIRPPVSRALKDIDVDEYAREMSDLTCRDPETSKGVLEDHAVIEGLEAAGQATTSHMRRFLLTPLPTILKADRLGIGLKAKTEGPHKQPRKRVTHNAAALATHIRSAEEMHRKKATFGKGRRGFAKIHKREEDKRKTMLAYLNE